MALEVDPSALWAGEAAGAAQEDVDEVDEEEKDEEERGGESQSLPEVRSRL